MSDAAASMADLLRQDRRYKLDAYAFVFESLRYGHEKLGMGAPQPTERSKPRRSRAAGAEPPEDDDEAERHLTGQQLCEAIRQYALDQYGLMAKTVLNTWGVTKTGDFGEIVFNLIRVGQMRKTEHDRREHFDEVFDFDEGLTHSFRITPPEENGEKQAEGSGK